MEQLRKTNLLYWSVWLLVMACLIWVSTKIDFIFYPIGTFISTIFTPVLVAGFLYYIFTPFIEMLENRLNIKRPIGILIVMVLLIGIVIFSFLGLIPNLVSQIGELLTNLPSVVRSLNKLYQQVIEQEWVAATGYPNPIVSVERKCPKQHQRLPERLDGQHRFRALSCSQHRVACHHHSVDFFLHAEGWT